MENFQDIYNYAGLEHGHKTQQEVYDLIKAMSAGSQTGRDLDGTITSGSSLKVESLDPTLKVLVDRDKHIVFWKMLPKDKAYNTVEEFNQLVDYGGNVGIFNNEGETPQFTDSQYRRNSVLVKYAGISGEVTHPFTLVNLGSGVGNALAKEVQNKTQFLLRALNKALPVADSALVSDEFDGIFKQHYSGIVGSTGTLDTYAASSTVIDARGNVLTETNVEDAVHAVVNDGFGIVDSIMGAPVIWSDFAKRFHDDKRVNVGQPGAVEGATVGQSVDFVKTQFGKVPVASDIFFDKDRITPRAYNQAATSTKAPTAPVTGGAPSVTSDASYTKFANFNGNYFYAVSAKNRYGESALTILSTTASAVGATQSVDLLWTYADGAYAAESFVIYRTEKNATPYTTANFYPIFSVTVAQRTAGYDGGAATYVRDRNRWIPNTVSAIVYENGIDVLNFKQLAPMMRMDLAITSPSYRFMILCYGTPVIYAPRKMARIVNIGRTLS